MGSSSRQPPSAFGGGEPEPGVDQRNPSDAMPKVANPNSVLPIHVCSERSIPSSSCAVRTGLGVRTPRGNYLAQLSRQGARGAKKAGGDVLPWLRPGASSQPQHSCTAVSG